MPFYLRNGWHCANCTIQRYYCRLKNPFEKNRAPFRFPLLERL
jgi:hypothetical protein